MVQGINSTKHFLRLWLGEVKSICPEPTAPASLSFFDLEGPPAAGFNITKKPALSRALRVER